MSDDRPATAVLLDLEPHAEGGWFRRMWTGGYAVETPAGERPAATCIHYLLTPGEESAWHVVTSDEVWLWHGPGKLALSLGGSDESPSLDHTVVLGPDLAAGERLQYTVPAGVWQAARLVADQEVVVSCLVSPGFSFEDWRLAD
ncbi:cupin [Microbacterium testaceum]|uniref:cupin domain-containing protein n=1 Tax=Microbacterium testaceum TaxID=2033 RepID=UPI000734A168|nr:cupin domain-containing protein [Microbacterium testaceum]KTS84858.1 cupin [Microbacterium testaceum]